MRCSIVYSDVEKLLLDCNQFMENISKGKLISVESECKLTKVIRIKNGFNNILNWKSLNDAEYCDMKFNVIFNDKKSNTSCICEIQFLLLFLKKAKEMGHKYYNISRRKEFIDNVSNIVHNNSNNYQLYSTKILNMIIDNNINGIGKQLILKPNFVFSIIGTRKDAHDQFGTLLFIIGSCTLVKMWNLFLDGLFDYCTNILNQDIEDGNNNDQFLTKYLNFNDCNWPAVSGGDIFGWHLYHDRLICYPLLERVFLQPCFKGLNQMDENFSKFMLQWWVCWKFLPLIELLMKREDINGKMLSKGISNNEPNTQPYAPTEHPFVSLFKGEKDEDMNVNKRLLEIIFSLSLKYKEFIDDDKLDFAIKICDKKISQNKKKYIEYKAMIQDYIKQKELSKVVSK